MPKKKVSQRVLAGKGRVCNETTPQNHPISGLREPSLIKPFPVLVPSTARVIVIFLKVTRVGVGGAYNLKLTDSSQNLSANYFANKITK